ncbi:MAG: ATP-binding protein [Candidatus Acidiferrum sp.]
MKSAATRKKTSNNTFEQHYQSQLLAHLRNPDEVTLGAGYELGRTAVGEGRSLLELVSLHDRALQELVGSAANEPSRKNVFACATAFLMEALSPFEMSHRGFQDAVKSLRRLNETLEEEIKRIAYAVHDEAGQSLVAVHLALAELAASLPEQHQQQLAGVHDLLECIEKQLRRFSHELRPLILDDLGWIPAVRSLADAVSKRSGLRIEFETSIKSRLPASHETVLYRVVQEALTNAAKHSQAKCIRIQVRRLGSLLNCTICDDGIGFDLPAVKTGKMHGGLGLLAMRERLNAIGGTFSIRSSGGQGTTIQIQIPREKPDAHSHRPRR